MVRLVFKDHKVSGYALGSAAWALGRVGGTEVVAELLKILEPAKENGAFADLNRAMAANALGQLMIREEARVLHRLSEDLNYRASVSGLDTVLSVR